MINKRQIFIYVHTQSSQKIVARRQLEFQLTHHPNREDGWEGYVPENK